MLQEDPDYDCGVRSSAVFGGLLTLSLFAGCHDLGLPPEPGSRPGSVTVTALVPREGQAELVPASGAVLELVGSGLRAEADADGNVRLEGIRQGTGQLSLTATSPGSTDTFARVFDVALSGVTTHEHVERIEIFPNTQDIEALSREVEARLLDPVKPLRHGFLIAGHGLYAWGKDLAEARRHIEAIEFLLEVVGVGRRSGGS